MDFNRYWTYDEITSYMRQMEASYPSISRVEQMGRTEEGRDILGIRIGDPERLADGSLPVVLITAAANARDWITAMSAVNLMHMLLDQYVLYRDIVDNLEWFIVPVTNPDGYVFSMTPGNRDWIKNRRQNNGTDCRGVNIERNFDFNWDWDINSSSDPCAENFKGTTADSEEETRTIQFAVDIFHRIQHAYVSLQAGTHDGINGLITYPYAYSNEGIPNNWEEQQNVAWDMSDDIRFRSGARYLTGTFSNIVVPTGGTSMDYAAGVDDVPLSYTILTPPFGQFGWDAEPWRINAVVDQVFMAIETLARYAIDMPLENP
ncbi:hypothetical protein ACKWTF_003231 [Chironomus riparius]